MNLLRLMWLAAGPMLIGCGGAGESAEFVPGTGGSEATLTAEQQARYSRTCGLCHGVDGTGAPAPQDQRSWQARNAQGMTALLDHTINGYGGMPPMGLCMDCSQDDLAAFIQFMSGLECEQ